MLSKILLTRRRTGQLFALAALLLVSATLPGCMEVVQVHERMSAAGQGEVFSRAERTLPSLKEGRTRIYFYRPQALLGFYGSPIVIVNGTWMGDKSDWNRNLFLPGCVFVVDTDAPTVTVWLYQAGNEDTARKLVLPGGSKIYYLRNRLHATYMDLESVDAQQAVPELMNLRLSGYVELGKM